ncbi:MAG: N-acetyl sugar amidotransferase [Clostridiales bacterium]|nr:N-acetyl sugar amidotransferase [Candidatus Crickella merdequi]
MDNKSDEKISFNEKGECNYCADARKEINTITYFPGSKGKTLLDKLISEIKEANKDKEYDCIMGISGGLDSSYLAYLGHLWGLRILGIHIDDGFDTDVSKENIRKLCEAANIELKIIKPDKEQYIELIKAYMKAGVPNLAVPQDNILFAYLYKIAKETKIKYFLSGGNFALECILQQGNTYDTMDVINIVDINRRFGKSNLDKLEFCSSYKKYYMQKTKQIINVRPLNYIDYNRDRAFKELADFCGFEYYGSKHLENIFTAFVQLYWLPKKFGVDKRHSHLSSMIVSGQLTRNEAIELLQKPAYDAELMDSYIEIIKDVFNFSDDEFDNLMAQEKHYHEEYKTDKFGKFVRKLFFS